MKQFQIIESEPLKSFLDGLKLSKQQGHKFKVSHKRRGGEQVELKSPDC